VALVIVSSIAGLSLFALAVVAVAARRRSARLADLAHRLGDVRGDVLDSISGAVEELLQEKDRAVARAALLGSALDSAEFGVIAVGRTQTVLYANAAARRFIGARHGDAVAERHLARLIEDVRSSGQPSSEILELYTPTHRHLGFTAVPAAGGGLVALVYVQDMSDRFRVDAVRRDFVANVSHELKTPLGALTVLADALMDAEEPEVRRRLAARIADQAARMAQLIDGILDLSLVESDPGERSPVVIDEVVREAVSQMAPIAGELGVRLEVEGAASDTKLSADARQLVSAVANLLDNAVKFTAAASHPAGGRVVMRVLAQADAVVIEVDDDGIGIPKGHLDRIFERFYRVDRARSRETGGTGLGLSIVRHVALNHGGSVEVASQPGEGARFRMTIPRGT